jgi:hypothetical protein
MNSKARARVVIVIINTLEYTHKFIHLIVYHEKKINFIFCVASFRNLDLDLKQNLTFCFARITMSIIY